MGADRQTPMPNPATCKVASGPVTRGVMGGTATPGITQLGLSATETSGRAQTKTEPKVEKTPPGANSWAAKRNTRSPATGGIGIAKFFKYNVQKPCLKEGTATGGDKIGRSDPPSDGKNKICNDRSSVGRPVGIKNKGNTCYLAAVVQLARWVDPLGEALRKVVLDSDMARIVIDTLDGTRVSNESSVAPALGETKKISERELSEQQDVVKLARIVIDTLDGMRVSSESSVALALGETKKIGERKLSEQQDVVEFVDYLVDAIGADEAGMAKLNGLLGIEIQAVVRADEAEYVNSKEYHDYMLRLPIEGVDNVTEALEKFRTTEVGDGLLAVDGGRHPFTNALEMIGVAGTVLIQLGSYNMSARVRKPTFSVEEIIVICGSVFAISGAVVHLGTGTSNGHYVCYFRTSDDGSWSEFDDDRVTTVRKDEVIRVCSKYAYVLVYRKVEDTEEIGVSGSGSICPQAPQQPEDERMDDIDVEAASADIPLDGEYLHGMRKGGESATPVEESLTEVSDNYLQENFEEEKATGSKGDCVFESLCLSMGMLDAFSFELRQVIVGSMDDSIFTKVIDATLYKKQMCKRGSWGGDFELEAFARIVGCIVVVFERKRSNGKQWIRTIFGDKPELPKRFRVFAKRTFEGLEAHMVSLRPRKKEFYVDFGEFEKASSELARWCNDKYMDHDYFRDKVSTGLGETVDELFVSEEQAHTGETLTPPNVVGRPDGSTASGAKTRWRKKGKTNGKVNEDAVEAPTQKAGAKYPNKNECRKNDDKSLMTDAANKKKGRPDTIEHLVADYEFPIKYGAKDPTVIRSMNRMLEDESSKLWITDDLGWDPKTMKKLADCGVNGIETSEEKARNMGRNVFWDVEVEKSQFFKTTGIRDELAYNIGPCIDVDCSGLNAEKKHVWKVFNDLYKFKDHARVHHKMSPGSIVNFRKPEGFKYVGAYLGAVRQVFLMKDEDIPPEVKNKTGNKEIIADAREVLVCGWNAQGASKTVNRVMIRNFLLERKPDFLLLNDCGKFREKSFLKNTDYKMRVKSRWTAIIYKSCYKVNEIMREMSDDYNQVVSVALETGKDLILYNAYLSPSEAHDSLVDGLCSRIKTLKGRYDAKTIVFGDLNLKRDELEKRVVKSLRGSGVDFHYCKKAQSFTRIQKFNDSYQSSYLDYFATSGIKDAKMRITKPLGKSDHMTLELRCSTEELGKLHVRKELRYNFGKAKKDAEMIKDELMSVLRSESVVPNLVNMIKLARTKYKPSAKGRRNIFQISERVKDFVKNKEKATWNDLAKVVSKTSSEEYHAFMSKFEEIKLNGNMREYFLRMRFYADINKKTDLLKDLVDEQKGEECIIDEQVEIDSRVIKKYKALMKDFGVKEKYDRELGDDCPKLTFSADEVRKAMEKTSFDKATGWDFIPGEVFKLIMKDVKLFDEFCERAATLFTELINRDDDIPSEIILARLVCLNKNGNECGRLDSIRPIAVNTMLTKIMGQCIHMRLGVFIENNKLIDMRQIGFRKGLGGDLNLMRLRQKVECMKAKDAKTEKFLLFIDFKQAYDSVVHRVLFEKMEKLGVPLELVRAMRKIYSNAWLSPTLVGVNGDCDVVAVNAGVLQGEINSPNSFNLYVNDLLQKLAREVFDVLAYADDIVICCKDRTELKTAMDVVQEWCTANGMEVNKKKSGVMPIHNKSGCESTIDGYPVKNQYKYLGIMLDTRLDPRGSVVALNFKLKEYLNRSNWIIKKYFTPKSLITLARVYQESRIVYGLCSFLDHGDVIDIAQNAQLKYIRSLLGLKNNVSKRRTRMVFGLPKLEHMLLCRLMKNVKKYVDHFGEYPSIYDKTVRMYAEWSGLAPEVGMVEPKLYKKIVYSKSVTSAALAEGVEIGDRFWEVISRNFYKAPDRRENLVVKYLLKWGFFDPRLFPVCELCGKDNSRTHVTNECDFFEKLRSESLKKIGAVLHLGNIEKCSDLEKWLTEIYFSPALRWTCKQLRGLLEVLKRFCASVYIDRPRKPSGRNEKALENGYVSPAEEKDGEKANVAAE